MSRAETVRALEAARAIAVVRLADPTRLRPAVEALVAGGVRAVELTLTTPGALEALAALATRDSLVIGAGSVLDAETARLAILAGARFVVAPNFSPALVEMCHRYDVAAMPGAFTPTEILAAWQAGADLVKIFPAARLGPGYLADLRGPLPQLKLVPTGGVSAADAAAYLRAGAVAVGVGGALLDGALRADWARITDEARRLLASLWERP
jgi:2-dehydro-3-deoxyphosphogluconate aldolase/(4S)-4-hydroxy-2-oxoglutarate aldolase